MSSQEQHLAVDAKNNGPAGVKKKRSFSLFARKTPAAPTAPASAAPSSTAAASKAPPPLLAVPSQELQQQKPAKRRASLFQFLQKKKPSQKAFTHEIPKQQPSPLHLNLGAIANPEQQSPSASPRALKPSPRQIFSPPIRFAHEFTSIKSEQKRLMPFVKIYNKWEYMCKHQKSYVKEHIRSGIPKELRPLLWMRISRADKRKHESAISYHDILRKPLNEEDEEQIIKDLHRTFPEHESFVMTPSSTTTTTASASASAASLGVDNHQNQADSSASSTSTAAMNAFDIQASSVESVVGYLGPISSSAPLSSILASATTVPSNLTSIRTDTLDHVTTTFGGSSSSITLVETPRRELELPKMIEAHPKYLKMMYKVLRAYCNLRPDIGYSQGMNYICGFLLSVFHNEEDTFWVFSQMMDRQDYACGDIFMEDLVGLEEKVYILDRCFKKWIPKLHTHLHEMGITTSYFGNKWLLTMFCMHFPFPFIERVMDNFFLQGWRIIFKVSLELLKEKQEMISSLPIDEIGEVFGSARLLEGIQMDKFFKRAVSQKIQPRHMDKYHKEYVKLKQIQIMEEQKRASRPSPRPSPRGTPRESTTATPAKSTSASEMAPAASSVTSEPPAATTTPVTRVEVIEEPKPTILIQAPQHSDQQPNPSQQGALEIQDL